MQNEQIEHKRDLVLLVGTRSRIWIRREAIFVYSIKQCVKLLYAVGAFCYNPTFYSFESNSLALTANPAKD